MAENKLKFTGRVEQRLYEAALKGEDTDVEFKFGGPTFPVLHAHRPVLVSESNAFKAMLKDCWKRKRGESKDGKTVIDLPVDDVEDFKTFLQYLYGAKIRKSDSLRAVPAYNLADKYEAMRVIECCEDFFFGSSPISWNKLDYSRLSVADLGKLLVLSKTCHNEGLFPYVFKQVMNNINRLLVPTNADWLDWEESTFVAILEADVMKKFPRVTSESGNEVYLLSRAIEWIEYRSVIMKSPSSNPGPSKIPRVIDFALAVRILQKIRFCQMKDSAFKKCLQQLAEIFPVGQIGQISLQYSGMGQEKLVDTYGKGDHFIMDTRMRDMLWN